MTQMQLMPWVTGITGDQRPPAPHNLSETHYRGRTARRKLSRSHPHCSCSAQVYQELLPTFTVNTERTRNNLCMSLLKEGEVLELISKKELEPEIPVPFPYISSHRYLIKLDKIKDLQAST